MIRKMLDTLLSLLLKDTSDRDRVRVVLNQDTLDQPISIPYVTPSRLTSDLLLVRIASILQSKSSFRLDQSATLHFYRVQLPDGAGRTKRTEAKLEEFLKVKKSVVRITNDDDLCLARAIVTGIGKLERDPQYGTLSDSRYTLQRMRAEALHDAAGVPKRSCGLEEVKIFEQYLTHYRLVVMSPLPKGSHSSQLTVLYRGLRDRTSCQSIYLLYHNNHFDLCASPGAYIGKKFWCHECLVGYNDKKYHPCDSVCHLCLRGTCTLEHWTYCSDCHRFFMSSQCFDNHKIQSQYVNEQGPQTGDSICQKYLRCLDCHELLIRQNSKNHVCGQHLCKFCQEYVSQGHLCYMQPLPDRQTDKQQTDEPMEEEDDSPLEKPENGKPLTKYVWFDFEAMIERKHEPNLCVAQRMCEQCITEGMKVTETSECVNCGKHQHAFRGIGCASAFCEWLFHKDNHGAIVFAHNFKGYDSYFILRYLYDNALVPDVIFNGAKIMTLSVPQFNMKFLDSFNFLPTALSKLPEMFDLGDLCKGYFPHLFNTPENQHYCGSMPDVSSYDVEGMKLKDQQKFLAWYGEQVFSEYLFDFQKEILKYCIADVHILRLATLKFRSLFMDISGGMDPYRNNITIASVCNTYFRTKCLKPETIALIPAEGYRSKDVQSQKALHWLRYLSETQNLNIRHALNGGEVRVGNYKLDGLGRDTDGTPVAYEFQGCFWHGCNKCYSPRTVNHVLGVGMGDLHEKTLLKEKFLSDRGYRLVTLWEHDYDAMLRNDSAFQAHVKASGVVSPLDPRKTFYGGRTEAYKLHHAVQKDDQGCPLERIRYLDVTSLYPWVNATKAYGIGHPKIITENFDDVTKYFGLVKCKILPSRQYHGVLPMRVGGKLMFPLCSTCATEMNQGQCHHSDEERCLVGEWCSIEIVKALEMGYQMIQIYEVWHFEETSDTLFRDYISTFLKIKQEASGWPREDMTESEKWAYIEEYFQKEGIRLDYDKIKKNPGLRALAKLMLNSFWGKFGQRQNMSKTLYSSDPSEVFDLFLDDRLDVLDLDLVNDDMVCVTYRYKDEFVETSDKTNVVIAAFTTAHARLRLYDLLEQLGERVLYADTDSAIFLSRPGDVDPPTGYFLGELTDEIVDEHGPGSYIDTFVSAGPKNYAYKVNNGKTEVKVKGITLNVRNLQKINFDSMLKVVLEEQTDEDISVENPYKIKRDKKTASLLTVSEVKQYRKVLTKRRVVDKIHTLPYGY